MRLWVVENKFRPINQNFSDKFISYIAKANERKLWTITTFSDLYIYIYIYI